MANLKLVVQPWGVEIHTRKEEKDSFRQTGASVDTDGLSALKHYLGRELTPAEQSTVKTTGFLEVG